MPTSQIITQTIVSLSHAATIRGLGDFTPYNQLIRKKFNCFLIKEIVAPIYHLHDVSFQIYHRLLCNFHIFTDLHINVNDVEKYGKYVMTSKHMLLLQKVRKIYHNIKSTSWRRDLRPEVKEYVMISKGRDLKKGRHNMNK